MWTRLLLVRAFISAQINVSMHSGVTLTFMLQQLSKHEADLEVSRVTCCCNNRMGLFFLKNEQENFQFMIPNIG